MKKREICTIPEYKYILMYKYALIAYILFSKPVAENHVPAGYYGHVSGK